MLYRKLKRTHTHWYINYIPKFKETFPELKKVDSEELAKRFNELNMDFYYEKKKSVPPLIRLTLPFALILMLLMIILLPINFIIRGKWSYSLGEKNIILNWFRSLRLM